jgi:long-chain acyl-CoA synthetase
MQAFQLEKPDNLVDWWQESLDKYADRNLIGTKNKDGVFEWATRREINARIDHLRSGLALLGVSEGDAVGIIANNRLEWVVAAFATWGRIARYVPMYEAELVQIWKYIVTDSQIKVLFVSKPEIYEKIKHFPAEIPTLQHIFVIDAEGDNSMAALEKKGAASPFCRGVRRRTTSPNSFTRREPPAIPRACFCPTAISPATPLPAKRCTPN